MQPQAIEVFTHYYHQLEEGVTGLIPEDSIEPLTDPPMLSAVEVSPEQAAEALAKWGPKGPTLVLCDPEETGVLKSFRNIPKAHVLPVGSAGVADVIGHASLIVTQAALETLEARFGDVDRMPKGEEGEVKFFIDGDDEFPTICGTGTEDYF